MLGQVLSFRLRKQTSKNVADTTFKGTVMQMEKALINDRLRVSRLS